MLEGSLEFQNSLGIYILRKSDGFWGNNCICQVQKPNIYFYNMELPSYHIQEIVQDTTEREKLRVILLVLVLLIMLILFLCVINFFFCCNLKPAYLEL